MKNFLILILCFFSLATSSLTSTALAETSTPKNFETVVAEDEATVNKEVINSQQSEPEHKMQDEGSMGEEVHHGPPTWLVIPFMLLLGMIATGPLFYEHFWHKNYPIIAIFLALIVVFYYVFSLENVHGPIHSFAEYVQFIALLASLYMASGGILIKVDKKATPGVNTALLIIGAVISNLIGTTGASMLLVRPFIRMNKGRVKAYHIIFFIFMVSNAGGALTPIGDPPLFLGFLKGVPFFWTLEHNILAWAFCLIILAVLFYIVDKRNKDLDESELPGSFSNKISIVGGRNFLWLGVVIAAVFLDPNVVDWVPAIQYDGTKFSYLREVIMLSVAYLSHRFANKEALRGNEFNMEPIREVALIFIGIFGTMMPALELVSEFAKSDAGTALINHNSLYWGTGFLSGVLDNAPTYLNFLAAAMGSSGMDVGNIADVAAYANGSFPDSILSLRAISLSAVFFGALTYIGNGPNFMVKSISEQTGVKMPSFFGYIIRYSIPILLPILLFVWIIFFAFQPA
ncbi:sodium:proton antiporter [Xanthovirga aplysinae]|uniref:sodium:proton antiporter n=1 Tax=Xanthovirga aplysinae TaxID=2529853 RepID=UPI0012BD2DE6|nr:sodium:proton antiporter [Xanthovirga aplysinae]MTI33432.1 citrate transporter [Xanthovirga aplysinae]